MDHIDNEPLSATSRRVHTRTLPAHRPQPGGLNGPRSPPLPPHNTTTKPRLLPLSVTDGHADCSVLLEPDDVSRKSTYQDRQPSTSPTSQLRYNTHCLPNVLIVPAQLFLSFWKAVGARPGNAQVRSPMFPLSLSSD
ncbi:hypothetical protein J6590_005191 [Homalodisca vitripennis]|nr:hypothetical protein J6590_005191 [Homalodisca vitripennis]